MQLQRASGLLLHPTSLPGPYGIGDLGPEAHRFLRFLEDAGQRAWQVLPLNPVGAGNSPYSSYSAFAGEPLLISLDRLVDAGLLRPDELDSGLGVPDGRVVYEVVREHKIELLRRAHTRFSESAEFEAFLARKAAWLDDYALFMALKDAHNGDGWHTWETDLAARAPAALERARRELRGEIHFHAWVQFCFAGQYDALKREASARGIRIIGDLPIFVAFDSADVWAHPDLFHLDAARQPTVVAGVPPDYFSATGQLWGNPLYNWDALARDGYKWWTMRLSHALSLYDLIRIDHFRGFRAYWEVPATETTAINGRWVPGPGLALFSALSAQIGDLPIIAEDLGIITPDVEHLRDTLGLPGMKVLQFAFNDPTNPYLPHNHVPNSVVYTGTHDNDTTRGWWERATDDERTFVRRYLDRPVTDPSWNMIRTALSSVSALAMLPVQDVLGLGSEHRMNVPGTEEGNWEWRLTSDALTPDLAARLRGLTELYGR